MTYTTIASIGAAGALRGARVQHAERAGRLRHLHRGRAAAVRVPPRPPLAAARRGARRARAAAVPVSHCLDRARRGGPAGPVQPPNARPRGGADPRRRPAGGGGRRPDARPAAVLQDRLMSLGNVSEDASGQERLAEYAELLERRRGHAARPRLRQHGRDAGGRAGAGWAARHWLVFDGPAGRASSPSPPRPGRPLRRCGAAWRSGTAEGVALAGVMLGALVQIPLAAISSSEIGFLFWSLAAVGAAATRPVPARAGPAPSRALTVRG